jgi:peptidylprolyl isomerase
MRMLVVIGLLTAALSLGACGSSGGTTDTGSASSTISDKAPSGKWAGLEEAAGANADELIIPQGPPPEKKVIARNLEVGDGPELKRKDWMVVAYKSFNYRTGAQKESNPRFGQPWGEEKVVKGWEEGLKGIRVGGIREMIVPSELVHSSGAVVYVIKLTEIL